MSITFNADEIFEIAEQIERNGARFYREAAGNASDADVKNMLQELLLGRDQMWDICMQRCSRNLLRWEQSRT